MWDRGFGSAGAGTAHRIANLLKARYSASVVTLYGSLAETCFHDRSHLDILVEGFRGQYWEMYVMADKIAGPFDLSIVCIEDAQDTLIEYARERGDLPLKPGNYLAVFPYLVKDEYVFNGSLHRP